MNPSTIENNSLVQIKNPFKNEESVLMKICMFKALIVGGAGYLMGVGISVFMNALEFREFDYKRGVKQNLKDSFAIDIK